MNIKEVENLLSVSRANVRFYEQEGLLTIHRKANNYRDYTEENIEEIKKIILFRKLGFTVDEIKKMKNGKLSLDTAAKANIERLEKEIQSLKGALALTQTVVNDQNSYDTIDAAHYLSVVEEKEKSGEKFADIVKDYLLFAADQFESIWKRHFFYDFKSTKAKYGVYKAVFIVILICFLRGLSNRFIWHESFIMGFLYPFILFSAVTLIITPLYFIGRRFPKVGGMIAFVLLILCLTFLAGIFLLIIVLLLNSFLHFWF